MLVKLAQLVVLVQLAQLVVLVKLVKLVSVHFFDIWTSKKAQNIQSLTVLTSKCASRYNGVHFFDIWTSKSGPNPSAFYTLDLEMCFAPQRCALFQYLNFQYWSDVGVSCIFWLGNVLGATTACPFLDISTSKLVRRWGVSTFWLGNVLRATTACTFSTSQLLKLFRTWCFLYILTWKCASCHNGVHFFDLFRHRYFKNCSEPGVFCAFWLRNVLRATTACHFSFLIWPDGSAPTALAKLPSWATNRWKNTVNRDFPTFLRTCIFFLLWSSRFFSSPLWLFPPLLPTVHIAGSFTSKLPSVMCKN